MLETGNSTPSRRINLWETNQCTCVDRRRISMLAFSLNRKSLSFKGTDFYVSWNLAGLSFCVFLLPVISRVFLYSDSLPTGPQSASLWEGIGVADGTGKSPRYLRKTEVLAPLQVGGRLFSLEMNSGLCVRSSSYLSFGVKGLVCVRMCTTDASSSPCIYRWICCEWVISRSTFLLMGPQRVAIERQEKTQAGRSQPVISTCLLLAIINVTTRHLSPAVELDFYDQCLNLIKRHKRHDFCTLNFIILHIRMSWAVRAQMCWCMIRWGGAFFLIAKKM